MKISILNIYKKMNELEDRPSSYSIDSLKYIQWLEKYVREYFMYLPLDHYIKVTPIDDKHPHDINDDSPCDLGPILDQSILELHEDLIVQNLREKLEKEE